MYKFKRLGNGHAYTQNGVVFITPGKIKLFFVEKIKNCSEDYGVDVYMLRSAVICKNLRRDTNLVDTIKKFV